ncbi:hypothetical protein KC19_2G258100, partial [Ceratodon purpureus]
IIFTSPFATCSQPWGIDPEYHRFKLLPSDPSRSTSLSRYLISHPITEQRGGHLQHVKDRVNLYARTVNIPNRHLQPCECSLSLRQKSLLVTLLDQAQNSVTNQAKRNHTNSCEQPFGIPRQKQAS